MGTDIERWLGEDGEIFLREIGIKKGQMVLDFGCGSGSYAIPATRIVGEKGRVYALDKDKEALNELGQRAELAGLRNIDRMEISGELEIDLEDASIDVVLLYDVLHPYYFPEAAERKRLLDEIRRVLKPNGLLSVYPKHRDLEEIKNEIEGSAFCLESQFSGVLLVHNEKPEKGKILNFRKKL